MKRALALWTTGVVAAAMVLVGAPAAHAETCGPEPTMPPWNGVYFDETGLHVNYGEVPNDVLGAAWWAGLWIQNYIDCEVAPHLPMEAVACLRAKEVVEVETKPTPRVGNRYVHVGTETLDVNIPLLMQDIADCTGG